MNGRGRDPPQRPGSLDMTSLAQTEAIATIAWEWSGKKHSIRSFRLGKKLNIKPPIHMDIIYFPNCESECTDVGLGVSHLI